MTVRLPARDVSLYREVDVLVAGGGPAGIGAAMAAARSGASVFLAEKRGFLGGNITACYVETCNHFMRNLSYKTGGIGAEMEERYRAQFGNSGDIRPDSPHRFSSEYLKIFLDGFVSQPAVSGAIACGAGKAGGVEISLHSFINETAVKDSRLTHAVIQSKQGPLAVAAKVFIDCTGDGDLAFAAGVPFDQGRDTDHRCQPGTLNFRLGGVDAARLTSGGKDHFRETGKKFREDYRAGRTGLSCKRQDIPGGRITAAGQLSYVNYPCAYGIDPTSAADLTFWKCAVT